MFSVFSYFFELKMHFIDFFCFLSIYKYIFVHEILEKENQLFQKSKKETKTKKFRKELKINIKNLKILSYEKTIPNQ